MDATNLPVFREDRLFEDVKRWIESGGSASAIKPESNWWLLNIAAEFQCVEAIEYLISQGGDPNLPDKFGSTPLHISVDSEIDATTQVGAPLEYRATKRLLEFGADLTIKNMKGETPLDWINKRGTQARRKFDQVMKRK